MKDMRIRAMYLVGCIALVTGCTTVGDTDDTSTPTDDPTDTPDPTVVRVDFDGLESLGTGFVYEGWLIVNGAPVSAGRFDIDGDGNADPDTFEVDPQDAEGATAYVLTIEPAEGDDPAPSSTHVLAGDLSDGQADLTVDHPSALATDFADAAGVFILTTPTTADDDSDSDLGIWFLVPGDPNSPGLELPTLPEGWSYEGWVVDGDGPISTGRFLVADEADSDGAGATAGPDGAPPFPGQDFIDPPISLIGTTAVISVEPDPDDSTAPFALKPLVLAEIADLLAPDTQSLDNQSADNNPTGTATIE